MAECVQVYDGSRANWKESDVCHPVNAYGRTKLEAEQLIQVGFNSINLLLSTEGLLLFSLSLVLGFVVTLVKEGHCIKLLLLLLVLLHPFVCSTVDVTGAK